MTSRGNGVSKRPRLTQSAYREAISETVRSLQNGDTDKEMAERWTVSAGTVLNARNKNNDLSGMPLLKLGERFGPDALSTVLALIGAKAVPDDAVTVDVSAVPCDVAGTLPLLIELFRDGECCDGDIRKLDQSGAIDCFLRVADMLRQRRDGMRLRAVQG